MTKPKLETLAIHAGSESDKASSAVIPAIHLSTTFEREADGSFPNEHIYTRSSNPNRAALEACITALEDGTASAAFSSGSAAASAVFRALKPGDHALIPDDMYWGIRNLLNQVFAPWGLELSEVDMSDLEAVKAALKPNTKLIWVETPSNPMLKITDIEEVAKLAKSVGAVLACDNTWTPPNMQPAFELGADIVMHSTTKYLAGHSDVLGGMLTTKEQNDYWERIVFIQKNEGAVPSPFDCWLLHRGIKTLPYRMRGHVANAEIIANYLDKHPKIERVYYPGLSSHPNHEVAKKHMRNYGAMLSVLVKGNEQHAMQLAANVQLFTRATSLGGIESLIEHRSSIEGETSKTPKNLLRISVGLEHSDDLIQDLEQALNKI